MIFLTVVQADLKCCASVELCVNEREREVVPIVHSESAETAVWELVDETVEEKRDG